MICWTMTTCRAVVLLLLCGAGLLDTTEAQATMTPTLVLAASANTTVGTGDTAMISCVGYVQPNLEITWLFNGARVVPSSLVVISTVDVTGTGDMVPLRQSFLQICGVTADQSGSYTCVISNGVVSDEHTIDLTVTQPVTLTTQVLAASANTSVARGGTALLTCVGYVQPNLEITWLFNGAPVVQSSLVTISAVDVNGTGNSIPLRRSFLQICGVTTDQSGSYTCVISNGAESDEHTIELTATLPTQVLAASANTSVARGDTATLTCVSYVQPNLEITWLFNGAPVEYSLLVVSNMMDVTGTGDMVPLRQSFLHICATSVSVSGSYTCVISNGLTSDEYTTQLTVTLPTLVLAASANTSVAKGDTATLTCVGYVQPNLEITWLFNGAPVEYSSLVVSNMVDVTGTADMVPLRQSFLHICTASVSVSGTYSCVVSNRLTSDEHAMELTVTLPTLVLAASANTTIARGDTATLTCVGYVQPNLEITWLFNGDPVEYSSLVVNNMEDVTGTGDMIPLRQSFLHICAASVNVSGTYSCVISNGLTSDEHAMELTVTLSTQVLAASANTTIARGDTATLTCVSYVQPNLEITWLFNGAPVEYSSLVVSNMVDVTGTGDMIPLRQSFLHICAASVNVSGTYSCVVSNGLTSDEHAMELTVTLPTQVLAASANTTIARGDTVTLTAIGYIQPNLEITWLYNGAPVIQSALVVISTADVTGTGDMVPLRQSFLQICAAAVNVSGIYTVVISNGVTSNEYAILLTVTASTQVLAASADTTISMGDTATVTAIGYIQPNLEITWLFNGAPVEYSSLVVNNMEDVIGTADMVLLRQSFLHICAVSVNLSGSYTSVISNGLTSYNYTIQLTVTSTAFVEAPQQTDFTADYNTEISFQCRADGIPLPNFTWSKDGTVIFPGGKITVTTMTVMGALRPSLSQSVVSTLRIRNVTESDMGEYNCRATNGDGSVVLPTPFSLSVNEPPPTDFCTPNPCQNGGQCSSDATTFSCTCQGQFFGTTCDMIADAPAIPTFVEQPTSVYTSLRGSAVLRCIAIGFPEPTIQWFKDGIPIAGQTDSFLSFDEVTADDRGFYHCTASNSEGTVTSPAVILSLTNIRQYIVPVVTDLAGFVDPSATLSQIRAALVDFVRQLNFRAAGSAITGDDFNAIINMLQVEITGSASLVPNSMMFRLELLVTLLNSTTVPAGAAVGVDEALQRIVDVATMDLDVRNLNIQVNEISRFDGCGFTSEPLVINGEMRGNLNWTETPIGFLANSECPCSQADISVQASRVCRGNFLDGGAWLSSNTSVCDFGTVGLQLCDAMNISVVEEITSDGDNLGPEDVTIVTDISSSLIMNIDPSNVDADLLDVLLTVIDNALNAPIEQLQNAHEQYNATNRLRNLLNQIIDIYPITTDPQEVLRSMFGSSIYSSPEDEGIIFSASLDGDIQFNDVEVPSFNIALPGSLTDAIDQSATPRVLFFAFRNEGLFLQRRDYLASTGMDTLVRVSNIAGAVLPMGVMVGTLSDPVTIIFFKTDTDTRGQAGCYYWDTQLDMGYGGWAQDGCMLVEETSDTVTCECNRLGSYTVLVDTNVQQDNTVGRFAIIGAAVFLICAILVLFCIFFTSGVRKTAYGAVLINLCIILILLYCIYIITHFVGGSEDACKAFAFLVHYFLLAACLALVITSFFTCFTLSESTKQRRGQVYFGAFLLNWILPLIIVAVSIGASTDNYYNLDSTPFCRPVNEPYWYGLLLMGGIFLVLGIVFIILYPFNAKYIHSGHDQKSSIYPRYTDYIAIIVITACFYIAWGFGLPATRPLNFGAARIIFEIIFIVFSILLGIAMVVCYTFLSEKVWKACSQKAPKGPGSRHAYGTQTTGNNAYTTMSLEIPFTNFDGNSQLPDYDDLNVEPATEVPFNYPDDESVAEEVGPDGLKEDLGN